MHPGRSTSALGALVGAILLVVACTGPSRPRASPATAPAASGSSSSVTTEAPSTSSTIPEPPVAPLAWKACAAGECATMMVPLDHAQPSGPKIGIAVARIVSTGDKAQRIGSLVMNPGGPGAPGVSSLGFLARRLPAEIRRRFDIVSFDPRGIGGSGQIHCLAGPRMGAVIGIDPSPDTPVEEQQLIALTKELTTGCAQRNAGVLAHIGTLDVARDMDLLRAALGDERLSYVGYSYGTYLGAAYAEMFPTKVRALVLDGPVDPTEDGLAGGLAQGIGFERAFQAFAADCAAQAGCPWQPAGGPSSAAAKALFDRIDKTSLPGTVGRKLTPGLAFYGVAAALYNRASWPALAAGLNAAEKGQGRTLLMLADDFTGRKPNGTYDGMFEANLAISCRDRPGPADLATVEAAAAHAATTAPLFGPALAWGAVSCLGWPVPPERPAVAFAAKGAPPLLVIGTTNDPATPIENAKALASQLSSGVLYLREGEGHTAYGGTCVDSTADAYLINLTVPPSGLSCR